MTRVHPDRLSPIELARQARVKVKKGKKLKAKDNLDPKDLDTRRAYAAAYRALLVGEPQEAPEEAPEELDWEPPDNVDKLRGRDLARLRKKNMKRRGKR